MASRKLLLLVACKTRSFVVFALLIALGSLAGAVYILADQYVGKATEMQNQEQPSPSLYPGVAILLQCLLIFVATWVMRFGNKVE